MLKLTKRIGWEGKKKSTKCNPDPKPRKLDLVISIEFDDFLKVVDQIDEISTYDYETGLYHEVTELFLENFSDEIYALVETIDWEEVEALTIKPRHRLFSDEKAA